MERMQKTVQKGFSAVDYRKMLQLPKVLLAAMLMLVLAGCMNDEDNNDAYDDSLYTDPSDGTNNNETLNGIEPNGQNPYDNDAGREQNQINEGTIRDDNTFEDEARDIIDDTEDVIRGKDGNINNP